MMGASVPGTVAPHPQLARGVTCQYFTDGAFCGGVSGNWYFALYACFTGAISAASVSCARCTS